MANHIKGIVSKKKKRYKEDGFDLDLAYIMENIIAMGFPASRLEGVYRNHIDDVVKFLELKHAGHYKIYNLCSERDYDASKFKCEIGHYPFDDHNPPNLGIIRPFCEDMAEWLGRNEQNVAAVHCKAGKGRTGVMICCYLLHKGLFSSAETALDHYGKQRAHDRQGVTIPSQRRYVEYYSLLIRSNLQYKPVTCLLKAVEMTPLPNISNLNSVQMTLFQLDQGTQTEKKRTAEIVVIKGTVEGNSLKFVVNKPVRGDIKIEVTHINKLMQKEKLLHCWFNTFFVRIRPFNFVHSFYMPQHSVDDSLLLCPEGNQSDHHRVRFQSGSSGSSNLLTIPGQVHLVDTASSSWRSGGPNRSGESTCSGDSVKENCVPLTKASSLAAFPPSECLATPTRVTLTKNEIDIAAKDKAQRFDKDFKILLFYPNVHAPSKGPFVPKPPPKNLRPEDEVFFNTKTKEIFLDYDEYFQREILCNSLVWGCELTGKTNLTYEEALLSEEKARRSLKSFPFVLKRAIAYAASQTQRGRIGDVWDDVFFYIRDRFFIDEETEALLDSKWVPCRIVKVLPPTQEEVDKELERRKSASEEPGSRDKNYLAHEVLPPAGIYKYIVEELPHLGDEEEEENDSDDDIRIISNGGPPRRQVIDAVDVKRRRNLYTREKNKLFLKDIVTFDSNQQRFVVASSVTKKYKLTPQTFQEIFSGPAPQFQTSLRKKPGPFVAGPGGNAPKSKSLPTKKSSATGASRSSNGKSTKQMDMRAFLISDDAVPEKKKKSVEDVDKLRQDRMEKAEKQKLTQEEEKKRKMQQRAQERAKRKEEQKKLMDAWKEYKKPREDLECDDLQPLPKGAQIRTRVPNHLFGSVLQVLEFLRVFGDVLDLKKSLSANLSLETLEAALCDPEVDGHFAELLISLLQTVFNFQKREDAEIGSQTDILPSVGVREASEDMTTESAVKAASCAAAWSQKYLGKKLKDLQIDSLTLTEILRLHIMSSGAQHSENSKIWMYQQRGGYTNHDDPGLQFRMEEPEIIQKLSSGCVYELEPGEKLKVLECLMNQILTYVYVRDLIDDTWEKRKSAKKELRELRLEETKKEKEEAKERAEEGGDKKLVETRSKTETIRAKMEMQKREEELEDIINEYSGRVGLHPLGEDRAYRRYWFFQSINALCIEHDISDVGDCLPEPTPTDPMFKDLPFGPDGVPDIRKFLGTEVRQANSLKAPTQSSKTAGSPTLSNGSDKENEIRGIVPIRDESDAQRAGIVGVKKDLSADLKAEESGDSGGGKEELFWGRCSADSETCPVHSASAHPLPVWYFISTPEDFHNLIQSLSQRGLREAKLRARLIEDKEKILPHLNDATSDILTGKVATSVKQKTKSRNVAGVSFEPGTGPNRILELTLRDFILELEEKILFGCLGNLKVPSREDWRAAIVDSNFNQGAAELLWGNVITTRTVEDLLNDDQKVEENGESDVVPPSPGVVSKTKRETFQDKQEHLIRIKQLASALLQLEQAIETKFFMAPLGTIKDRKKKRKLDEDDVIQTRRRLYQWELSLHAVTSASQIFLHLFTLESSITWDRSIQNVRCRVCRRKGDDASMLLCDGCDLGQHIYCMKPKMNKVPVGDWYCQTCTPPAPPEPKPGRPSRRLFSEVEDEDDSDSSSNSESSGLSDDDKGLESEGEEEAEAEERSDNEDEIIENGQDDSGSDENDDQNEDTCVECGSSGELITCDECTKKYHLKCSKPKLRRAPKGHWTCHRCEMPHYFNEEEYTEVCGVCQDGGELIMCDVCPGMYHLYCCQPKLSRVPKGKWSCHMCTEDEPQKNRSSQVKTSTSRRSDRSSRTNSRGEYILTSDR
ncbi:unnamed protein product [Cyprideis torosa]|uniref:Bromodomain adjacent to zinc finger domain protein 1A n=1 Tax=Cyprideis torosa TaxID=163714 RepID=A0A7R8WDW4_9CRUS|nr:unnamed protein product [Cyprideis torosa]CAG0890058.1 unnamed protein product [Cyprideis torosa]